MGNIVGIDLGTTNSVAAFKFAQVEVVTAADNTPPDRKLTRSVVAFTQNQLVVGQEAYNQLRADPENVIMSIKRLMGRGFADQEVQQQLSRFGYRVTQTTHGTENSLAVWLGGQELQPEDISAQILHKVGQNAQNFQKNLGQSSTITEAVITIPAYFNDKQRHATQTAAQRAGLNLRELLPEPTAAAISYGFTPEETSDVKTILVYDFGGGTFDACLLTVSGNQFIELGKAGNLWLGGDDIDQQIIQFVKTQVAQQENIDDIDALLANMPNYQRLRFLADLKITVEWAKVALSKAPSVQIIPPTPLLNELGMPIMIDVQLTREQFEQMISPLVERTIPICDDAIRYAEYTPDLVDIVLLVGGSSQIPLVQQKVREAFGEDKVVVHPRPMYAIAEGAAILAAGLTEKVGTVSRDYYIQLIDGAHKVISRGDVLPVRTAQTFRTIEDGQSLIRLELFNRDDELEVMEPIGKIWLPLYQGYPKGTEVMVTLELDELRGTLQIIAVLKNEPSVRVSSLFSRGGTDEKINEDVDEIIQEINASGYSQDSIAAFSQRVMGVIQVANQIVDPKTGKEREDVRTSAYQKYRELKSHTSSDRQLASFWHKECSFVANTYGFFIPPEQQARLREISAQLDNALKQNDFSTMQVGIEQAVTEMTLLPEDLQRILNCRDAAYKANRISLSQGELINDKKERMVAALRRLDREEADRIWLELQTEVQYWLYQEIQKGQIQTGLSR
ncbi:Hsp70 family protein [Nodularia spumigena]|jgi:molecular chaperone DnaK|uniref:Chaperone protein DnaK n=1 Tax=Nodularia spumigena UHCC 0039 TaxID=1914872 RepID=A0A2S0Q656_NODSP|nr:Hsp70 family protein [Nodularia spumigena]AVZ30195.1 chaperone protein DnaK [Nodularia spumigena UHCC 0039]